MASVTSNIKEFKASFFDRAAITDKVEAAKLKALARIGASIRTHARFSMGRRKAASPPGSPPSVHKGQLKNLIFYAYDPATKSVVVGPAFFTGGKRSLAATPVPAIEEKGGTQFLLKKVYEKRTDRKAFSKAQAESFKRKVRDGSIPPRRIVVKQVTAKYPARPFMAPALANVRNKLSDFFQNTL